MKKLYCFLLVLGYSKMRCIEFVTDMSTIRCHQNAFRYFDGYPEEILYDNMKQVVVKRHLKQEDSTLNRKFEDFAGFYDFKPILCRPYRGQTKGKVERNAENIVFLGPPGVGKTHLACALGMAAARHRFSTYYINYHTLIEQLKKVHFENRLPDRLRTLGKYKLLIIDEIGYLPMDIQGANLFFQLIARRYEKVSTICLHKLFTFILLGKLLALKI